MITAIVFLPLCAALIAGLFVRHIPVKLAQLLTCSAMVASAVLSGIVFMDVAVGGQSYRVDLLPWICLLYTSPSPRDA